MNETAPVKSDSVLWQARPYRPGDEAMVAQLYETVYQRPLDLDYYRWKLLDSPWPIERPCVWLADAGGRLAGHYGGTPFRFKLAGGEFIIMHGSDAMTSAAFRRQGVFSALGTAAHEAWAAGGIPFLIGVPNNQWGTRRAYLDYRPQFKAAWFWRPLRAEQIVMRRYPLPAVLSGPARLAGRGWHRAWQLPLRLGSQPLQIERVQEPGPLFDELWQQVGGAYEALIVRDRAWLAYRYTGAPGRAYRLLLARLGERPLGYLVYRVTGQGPAKAGWIVDFFSAPDDKATLAALLHAALETMYREGVGGASVLLPLNSRPVGLFRRAGFWQTKGTFDISVVPLSQQTLHPALANPGRWYTLAGDYDII
jgi:hypothetical protein